MIAESIAFVISDPPAFAGAVLANPSRVRAPRLMVADNVPMALQPE